MGFVVTAFTVAADAGTVRLESRPSCAADGVETIETAGPVCEGTGDIGELDIRNSEWPNTMFLKTNISSPYASKCAFMPRVKVILYGRRQAWDAKIPTTIRSRWKCVVQD